MFEHKDAITVIGSRVHNLRNIDVVVPLNSLTVITGVSGSGKSSLAFDTLYAEGQRRYVASLSAYARQFLERIERPDVTDIFGICPALAIRQKGYSRNPRSTVGTITEINDYLRVLFARIGTTICHRCGRPVAKDSPEKIADLVMALPKGQRLLLCIPLPLNGGEEPTASGAATPEAVKSDEETHAPSSRQIERRLALALPGLQQQGFARLLINDRLVTLADAVSTLRGSPALQVHVVADRLIVQEDIRERLVDSLELCSRESNGRVELLLVPAANVNLEGILESKWPNVRWTRHPAGILLKFSERFECPLCQLPYETPEPRLFSFNNPYGACPECQGFGNTITLDLTLVVPDAEKSLAEGAIDPWTKPRYRSFHNRLLQFAHRQGIDVGIPWRALPEDQRDWIINGKGDYPGVVGFFSRLEEKKYKMHVRIFISRYRGYATCPRCRGARLRPEARDVFVGGHSISEILQMTVSEAADFFRGLSLARFEAALSQKVLHQIRHRLNLLERIGLQYLTLDRISSTLSGGESQRIQLANSLGSTLVGALYVLDEPSIGLHARDSQRLIQILQSLKSLGNTVLVVEHDAQVMKSADHIIDLGPGAGENGGRVVYQGAIAGLKEVRDSLTGRYLKGELRIPTPIFRRRGNGRQLEILGARRHNLKNLDVRIPLGVMVCVTGVSGSGKSTLVHEVLYNAVRRTKGRPAASGESSETLRGAHNISDAILVDQSPIGRTPRSNPITYMKSFDLVRAAFAGTRDAYVRNFKASHFSFNLSGGRCEDCQGSGTITVEMQFLADIELTCEECKGTRYKSSVLEVRYKGRNIAEVLSLTVREALDFFSGHRQLIKRLRVLDDVGLGYLRLGQSATSLSGGEAQRIKLASFISGQSSGNILYIFDEPTTGLHFDDIRKLLGAFDRLLDGGNSILVIEHNLDVIKASDWVIDLGPEGGDTGGHIVFEGSPDDLVSCEQSYTGRFLKSHIEETRQPAPEGRADSSIA